jgi:hypothetical protein
MGLVFFSGNEFPKNRSLKGQGQLRPEKELEQRGSMDLEWGLSPGRKGLPAAPRPQLGVEGHWVAKLPVGSLPSHFTGATGGFPVPGPGVSHIPLGLRFWFSLCKRLLCQTI